MKNLILLVLLFSCSTTTQPPASFTVDVSEEIVIPKHYIVVKATDPLTIDGLPNERSWQNAAFTPSFIDIEGVKTPKFDTKVKMLWDDNFLYIFARMEAPHIWGNLKQRDTVIFYNNDFEVFIDPSGDTYNYGEIEINALGTVWDLLLDKPYRVGGKANNHWNLDELKTAIHIKGTLNDPSDIDSLWTVEMAIPMTPLIELKDAPKVLPGEGEQWRINFSRVNWDYELINGRYQRKKENGQYLPEYNWVWTNQKVINMHEPEKWGYLQFTSDPAAKTTDFIPDEDLLIKQVAYALFRKTRFGDLRQLTEKPVGFTQKVNATYDANNSLSATFYKTNMGFEFRLEVPETDRHYVINEEGMLKKL